MTQPYRTAAGGRILRDQTIGFRFDGRAYQGFQGDTLASALLANGVHLVGRSFKYHRPRGVLSAGSEEPNALVTLDRGAGRVTPNLRATQIELYDGLVAVSQNRFPSLRWDFGAAAEIVAPLLSAGFYYKTFMWPAGLWRRLYEPAIRAAAGLGRAPTEPDADRYAQQYVHCDLLVVGAGPAGLAAALSASAAGQRVILCDEQAELGGSLLAETHAMIDGWPAQAWLRETLSLLADRVTLLPRTTAFGWYPDNLVGLVERVTDHLTSARGNAPRERLWQVRAHRVLLATGGIERPMVFPGNDRPGIMLASAALTYLHRYGVRVGKRAVLATANDHGWRMALDLQASGLTVAAIVDPRLQPDDPALLEEAWNAGVTVHAPNAIVRTEGRRRVHSVCLTSGQGVIPCDTVLMAGGLSPTVHLYSQSRGRLRWDERCEAFLPDTSLGRVSAAGLCAGQFGLQAALRSGWEEGAGQARAIAVEGAMLVGPSRLPPPPAPHGKAFVDFQNDVTTKDLQSATAEGFRSIEHLKRYTTVGMATDQGKTSNLNALATVAAMQARIVPEIGYTQFRPPYTPVTFGSLAGAARGALFEPLRHAPLHDWAVHHGAVFEDVGTWRRARAFPRGEEILSQAVARECAAVRSAVGVFDASTLGKIEVVGPDAELFLNLVYTNDFSRLEPGRCRYALLLGEDGYIRDDGIVARLAPDRFHVTTTTGNAAFVLNHMEDYLQTEFPHLRVWLTSTTEHWAVIAVQGPRSAETLAPLLRGVDLSVMPHMSVRSGEVCGVPARVFRVSFTGEVGFEVNVPAGFAEDVWSAIMASGFRVGITPYGTEAMHVLRAEVGYIVVGQETDGTVIPSDLGLDGLIGRRKADFVGKRSLSRPDMLRPDRKQLVLLLTGDGRTLLDEGAQIVGGSGQRVSLGHVTSSYPSAAAGRPIALALLKGGRERIGETLFVPVNGRLMAVTVSAAEAVGTFSATESVATKPDAPAYAAGEAHDPAGLPQAGPVQPGSATPGPAYRLPRLHGFDYAAVRVTSLAPTTRLVIRAGMLAATGLGRALGVLLGTVMNRAITTRDRAVLCLGPDEWLVLAPAAATDLIAHADTAPGGHPASVVDVSHRHASLEIVGPRAAWCLNGFCALDLELSAFPVGMCTRTVFGKAEIILWRLGEETFHVEMARSLAGYVSGCLEEAAREFHDSPGAC